jgi:hypothetical protein
MMLEVGDQDRIPGAESRPAEALRDKINGFGRAAGEDNLAAAGGVDKGLDSISCAFVGFGCTMASVARWLKVCTPRWTLAWS